MDEINPKLQSKVFLLISFFSRVCFNSEPNYFKYLTNNKIERKADK